MKTKQVNNNVVNNSKIGFNPNDYKKVVTPTKTRNCADTKEMAICRNEVNEVLNSHYKTYEVTEFDHKKMTCNTKLVKGFLDRHPKDSTLYVIRTFNLYSPNGEGKYQASSNLEFIKHVD